MKKIFRNLGNVIILTDTASFVLGFVGSLCGIISLLSLEPFWNNTILSYDITIGAIFFDIASMLFILIAFIVGTKHLQVKQDKHETVKILKLEKTSLQLDFFSFFIGLIFEILSLVFLTVLWKNVCFSYFATILAVIIDISSGLLAVIALKVFFSGSQSR
ncbi:hypothetical protein [Spiroplasma mirum]|uniref:hypothetical protein n=1 Tax=Spiroplasma mirum TaxID=2144 RepID=UPI0003DFC0AD|nr:MULTISPECIES: hypothetical protein [Spiroplasma]AHF60931.1 hypothetical protein SMM_0502 [Spiroplasma mirum ATCC 29335]AKM53040.1 hypothetical protein SATRI_v1c05590 [Spiroplasma atrichopogonis]